MPRESERNEICWQLRKMIELEILMASSSSESEDYSSNEGDEDSNDSDVELGIGLEDETDSDDECSNIHELINLQLTRMDRDSFLAILAIIKDHDVFQNRSAHPQAPALVQLALALDRFGHEGDGEY
ncbi:hypothetical protein R1sor_007819 [Riccia sorocarpa]|uniref:Uncharacterized protein n=1 Tax=Riccia sorocarpa TaxID=122646 RepID=A0ABD3HRU6_9MARC